MFERNYNEIIQWKRDQLGLSQKALTESTGISQPRMSKLETGRHRPTEQEHRLLCQALQTELPLVGQRPRLAIRSLHNAGRRASQEAPPYFPPADRAARVRLLAAERRWPKLVRALTNRIQARPDYPFVNFLCSQLALDSADEALYVATRFAQGATAAIYPPLRLQQLDSLIRCPSSRELVGHRPFPCLVLGSRFEFPQVTLSTPRLYRVDFLVYDGGWQVKEIDGSGHDWRDDAEREAAIGLPTERLERGALLDLAERVVSGTIEAIAS